VVLLVIIVPAVTPVRQSASLVFTDFETKHANDVGIINPL
jgi:hypothetical protein